MQPAVSQHVMGPVTGPLTRVYINDSTLVFGELVHLLRCSWRCRESDKFIGIEWFVEWSPSPPSLGHPYAFVEAVPTYSSYYSYFAPTDGFFPISKPAKMSRVCEERETMREDRSEPQRLYIRFSISYRSSELLRFASAFVGCAASTSASPAHRTANKTGQTPSLSFKPKCMCSP